MTDNRITIVVVDDDEGHVELIVRNLRRAGLNNSLITLSDGAKALDYVFARGAYGSRNKSSGLLILLDINMPGLDGVEVLRQIKENPETKSIPVIMLTTTDDERAISRCYEFGCNVYVTKPIDPPNFFAAIHRLGLFLSVVSVPAPLAPP
jgi:CheY-like chemotaxis protein